MDNRSIKLWMEWIWTCSYKHVLARQTINVPTTTFAIDAAAAPIYLKIFMRNWHEGRDKIKLLPHAI